MPTSMFPRRFPTGLLRVPVAENRFISEMRWGSREVKMPSLPNQRVMTSFGFGEGLIERPATGFINPLVG
jgi:hypothetical protein